MARSERPRSELQPGALITIFGGSGFVGQHVVQALGRRGYRLRVAVRRPNEALFLKTSGGVGQIEPVQANIRDEASVRAAIEGASAVINLVGILSESGKQKFSAVQAEGAGRVARLARAAGVGVFIQMSAIGASADSLSLYAQSKAAGEAAVRAAFPQAAILRASVVFGPEDKFFNRFAGLARLSPVLPLIGAATRFQPVYVKDLAEAVARVLETTDGDGKVIELGGPACLTMRELMETMLSVIRRKRLLIPVPMGIAKIKAFFLQMLPNPLLTVDQCRSLAIDNVVSDEAIAEGRTLEGLGLTPTALQIILPTYLARFRKRGQFEPAAAPLGQD